MAIYELLCIILNTQHTEKKKKNSETERYKNYKTIIDTISIINIIISMNVKFAVVFGFLWHKNTSFNNKDHGCRSRLHKKQVVLFITKLWAAKSNQ